jgi:hypothetical protein
MVKILTEQGARNMKTETKCLHFTFPSADHLKRFHGMKTETKHTEHTPGPWHVQDDQASHGKNLCVVGSDHEFIVARVPFGEPFDKANARLIALAPQMKEALTEMLQLCREESWDQRGFQEIYNIEHLLSVLNE